MSLKKKIWMTAGIAAAAALTGGSTFASFTAQTSNPGNVLSTGSLVMSNQKDTATACLSTGSGTDTSTNVNDSCDQLFNVVPAKPGDAPTTVHLTLKNEGTADASVLKAFSAGCADADAAGTYHGTGNPCSVVELYIQETDSSFTATSCAYGGGTATTCAFDPTKTLSDYASTFTSSSNGLTLTGGLTHGASRYFVIGVQLPDVGNSYQGRQATVGFSWFMQ
jgi:hypothetical protein